MAISQVPQIAAQAVFGPEDNGPDRREAAVEFAGNLRVAHALVIAEHQRNFVMVRQAIQLFPHHAFSFLAQNLGERGWSGNVRDSAKIISSDNRAFLALPPAQNVNAMPACYLAHPRAEGILFILLIEDRVQFQENF